MGAFHGFEQKEKSIFWDYFWRRVRRNIANMPGRDPVLEGEILEWIAAMTGKGKPEKVKYEDFLGDGLVLCELINKLRPGSVKELSKGSGNFAKMENVAAFTKGVTAYGVQKEDMFASCDLVERRNIPQVTQCLGLPDAEAPGVRWTGFRPKTPGRKQKRVHAGATRRRKARGQRHSDGICGRRQPGRTQHGQHPAYVEQKNERTNERRNEQMSELTDKEKRTNKQTK